MKVVFRVLLLLGAWLLLLLLLVAASFFQPLPSTGGPGGGAPSPAEEQQLAKRLVHVFRDLDLLKRQNAELRLLFGDVALRNLTKQELLERFTKITKLLENSTKMDHNYMKGTYPNRTNTPEREPSLEYEQTRRRLENGVIEMWFFLGSELRKLQKLTQNSTNSSQLASKISHILEQGVEHKRSMLQSADQLARVDGYSKWRTREARELGELVQRRLNHLQNPPDCATARKLACKLNQPCGFGCQIHHVTACFIDAYASQSAMVLFINSWNYNTSAWHQLFANISDTCNSGYKEAANWPGNNGYSSVKSSFLPLAVPRDLAPRLSRLHGDPIVWWVGQFLRFLLRPQPALSQMLDEAASKLNFRKPIVGVHIRRTDKVGTEAAFHPLEEYMQAVHEYFTQLELSQPVDKRRVYLASDDPSVLADARNKYPSYEILGDQNVSLAAAVETRFSSKDSVRGFLKDIHFLSRSDFLVCTFSSNVCRLAYEMMQQLRPDAAARFRSLDDIYYYDGMTSHRQEVVMEHQACRPEEIDLKVGDVVDVAGNHWNGYSKGVNTRTGRSGLYPSHKVVDRVQLADFPAYLEVSPESRDHEEISRG